MALAFFFTEPHECDICLFDFFDPAKNAGQPLEANYHLK